MNTLYRFTILLPMLALAAACGSDEAPAEKAAGNDARSTAPAAENTGMPRSDAPQDARLYFIGLEDGDVVSSPVKVEFGLDNMDVVPAGTEQPASGHHHIIVDADLPPLDQPIPADEHHVHFGDGSTSTELELAAGEHSLQLLLGDHLHIPHQPPVSSERITITVE